MNPLRPGKEPDSDDMAADPAEDIDPATTPDLPEDDAERLGDFA